MLLLASLAFAQDTAPLPTAPPPWQDRYKSGMGLARAGIYVGAAGEALSLTGFVVALGAGVGAALNGDEDITDNPAVIAGLGMSLVGGAATYVGSPLMAAGSLKARRALQDGGAEVSPVPGYVAWGCWGATLALEVATVATPSLTSDAGIHPLSLLGGATLVGSYAAGGVQMGMDGRAFRGRPVALNVAPMPMRDGAGAAVAFSF